MKKFILLIVVALCIAGNFTALTWGGVDTGKLLASFDCKD
jgi:hypothetical protein